jgi:hypothetical protein
VTRVLFLFPRSAQSNSLDDFIDTTFAPGLRQAGGAQSVTVSAGELMSPAGPPPYSRVVEATFESLVDVLAAVEAPSAQSARQHLRDLGTLILTFEEAEI